MLEWKNLLKGHIALFVVSCIVGCVPAMIYKETVTGPQMSEYYYAIKAPDKNDLEALGEYYRKSIGSAKSNFGILIGGYYFKNNDYEISQDYLKANTMRDSYGFLDILGRMWLFYIYINDDDANGADKTMTYLEGAKSVKSFDKALRVFCVTTEARTCGHEIFKNLRKTGEVGVKDEIITTDGLKGERVGSELLSLTTDNKSEDSFVEIEDYDTMEEVVEINVSGIMAGNDLFKGLMLAIHREQLDYVLKMEQPESAVYKYNVYNEKNILEVNGNKINFAYEYNELLDVTANYLIQKNPEVVIVCSKNNNKEYVEYLKDILGEEQNAIFYGVTYRQASIRKKLEKIFDTEDKSIYFIGIGAEDDIIDFVPLAKFYYDNYEESRIISITDVFSGLYLEEDYKEYFNNTIVATFTNTYNDPAMHTFADFYENFYGSAPKSEAYIGYDMALFLYEMLGGKSLDKYVSGIINIKDNRVFRGGKLYNLNKTVQRIGKDINFDPVSDNDNTYLMN